MFVHSLPLFFAIEGCIFCWFNRNSPRGKQHVHHRNTLSRMKSKRICNVEMDHSDFSKEGTSQHKPRLLLWLYCVSKSRSTRLYWTPKWRLNPDDNEATPCTTVFRGPDKTCQKDSTKIQDQRSGNAVKLMILPERWIAIADLSDIPTRIIHLYQCDSTKTKVLFLFTELEFTVQNYQRHRSCCEHSLTISNYSLLGLSLSSDGVSE